MAAKRVQKKSKVGSKKRKSLTNLKLKKMRGGRNPVMESGGKPPPAIDL